MAISETSKALNSASELLTLCLDFGNTRKKAALFKGDKIISAPDIGLGSLDNISSALERYHPQNSILSSVTDHDIEIEKLLEKKTKFHKLSEKTKINFSIPVKHPETVGADRLALVAAAIKFFPHKNNLIIALGSCITYNFINQYHQFLGGAISPGKNMRFRAMAEFTHKLPLVEFDESFPLIGYNTKTNLQSGVVMGMTGEIDGFINNFAEKYSNFNVVLTGGDCAYFATQLKNKIFADFNFLFKGLYALSEINNSK